MTPLHISTTLNSVIYNNKKQVKQVAACKTADRYYQIARRIFVYHKTLVVIFTLF